MNENKFYEKIYKGIEMPETKHYKVDLYEEINQGKENLNDKEIIDRYFEIEGKLEPHYLEKIKNLSKEVGELSPNIELSIIIPSYKEKSFIQKTLEELKNNISLNDDQYEVILVINYPKDETPDETKKIAERFKKDSKWQNLKIIEIQFPKEISNVGSARKLGSDVALFRYQERLKNHPEKDVFYIAGTDSDLIHLPKDHYRKILEKLKNKKLQVIAGESKQKMEEEKILSDFLNRRPNWSLYYNFLGHLKKGIESHTKIGIFNITGPDFALTPSAYARIGGISRLQRGEDTLIGIRAEILNLPRDYYKDTHIITSSRRLLRDWEEMLFSAPQTTEKYLETSQKIRNFSKEEMSKLINAIPDLSQQQLKEAIISKIKRTAGQFHASDNRLTPKEALYNTINLAKEIMTKKKLKLPIDLESLEPEIYQSFLKEIKHKN